MLILKINKEGDMEWVNVLKRNTSSLHNTNLNGCLDYITEEGDLEIVFNGIRKDFTTGKYSPNINSVKPSLMFAVKGVTPVKAIIDLSSGDMRIKKADFKDNEVYALLISDAKKLDQPGEYLIKCILNDKPHLSVIDFKED